MERYSEIVNEKSLGFVYKLVDEFGSRAELLLEDRIKVKEQIKKRMHPDFLEETRSVREGDWKVSPFPKEVADRRIEITGPVNRKMVINALNSGANVFMADFEDSNSPTWENCILGQINLKDAVQGRLAYDSPEGKKYRVRNDPAVLFVRPRGLHLFEVHLKYKGSPIPASLIDFGLYFFNNAKQLVQKGSAPYFYLPKLQSYHEAKLWDDIFTFAEQYLGLEHGITKATVLIEHILASFQMDEILYALKDHSLGLNCGRWDYIFSFIKTFADNPKFILPDRSSITMDKGFLNAYVQLLIQTCHKRGTFAMGGMAAQIPISSNHEASMTALDKVYKDKLREVKAGHDGTWIAHPGLLEVARKPFDEFMPTPNQIHKKISERIISQTDLLEVPEGSITEEGVRLNINVGLQYLTNWLAGNGCVAINHLMEDAATAEISRSQLWQWLHNSVTLDDGKEFNKNLFNQWLEEERNKLSAGSLVSLEKELSLAEQLFRELTEQETIEEFLTVPAYSLLLGDELT